MKRRYLETVEDFLEFKDTDTKIYNSCSCRGSYYKFVNGYFCRFDNNGGFIFNVGIDARPKDYFVLEEESEQEATEDDIGKLCLFWNVDGVYYIGTLKSIDVKSKKRFYLLDIGYYEHCHKLSPSEVAELTGYRVEEAE